MHRGIFSSLDFYAIQKANSFTNIKFHHKNNVNISKKFMKNLQNIPKIFYQVMENKFLYFSFILLAAFLITSSNFFFWDAAVLEVGILEGDLSGWKDIHLMAGLNINYFYYFAVFKLSQILPGSHGILFASFSIIWISALAHELGKICRKYFYFSKDDIYFLKCLIFILPIWNILSSQVIHFYVFTYYLLFAGFNLFESKNVLYKFIALFFLLISFANAVNHLMIIGLAILPLGHSFTSKDFKSLKKFLYRFIFLSLFSILVFLVYRELFQADDFYENYNKLNILSFRAYLAGIFSFGIWFIFSIFIFMISSALSRIVFNQTFNNSFFSTKSLVRILSILFLLICAATPYILVNKYPSLDNLYTWESRHAILFLIILIPFILSINKAIFGNKKNSMAIFSLIIFTFFSHHMSTKIDDRFHFSILQQSLPEEMPNPGVIELHADLPFSNSLRHYGLSNIFYKKYDRIDWFIYFQSEESTNYNIPDIQKKYFGKMMQSLVGQNLVCKSTIHFSEFESTYQDKLNWLLFNAIPVLEIDKIEQDCKK